MKRINGVNYAVIDLGYNTIRLSVFRYEDKNNFATTKRNNRTCRVLNEGDSISVDRANGYIRLHAQQGTIMAEIQ